MRLVLDTNVLVSGVLTPRGTCAQLVDAMCQGSITPLYDDRTLGELAAVLARPRLGVPPPAAAELVAAVRSSGEPVAASPLPDSSPDPGDIPFVEVAVSGHADALVTGNARHFANAPILVLSPAQVLALLELAEP